MKKNITKKAAVFLLSTIVAAQSGLSVQAAALTEGSWEQTSSGWKFLNRDRQPYTGWIHTASGWYYLNIKANGYPDVEATDVGKDYGPDVEIEASAEVEDFEYTAKVKVRTGCIRAWKLFSRSGWNYSIC